MGRRDERYEEIAEIVFEDIKTYVNGNDGSGKDSLINNHFTIDLIDETTESLVYVNFDTDKYIFDDIQFQEDRKLFVNAKSVASIIGEIVSGEKVDFTKIIILEKDKAIISYNADEF
ncbi:hypothetical protein ETI09_06570 [Macrococcoides canis]|uniref:hypothetical protein n=2 Tax=Macrococcoides canis TaxID=1855823 RepID=UPI00105F74FB|nr:hypothetical protein [Macrococcus canis]TDM44038.1 hypothetical protein ETI09_06570 [Macrococcus canis]